MLTRTEAVTDPELAPALTELERRHGKESGLGGRDIAPYLFVGADRRGFFALSQRDGALLVWNYTGPEDHFAELAGEFFDHARRTGLRPNLLSLVRLTEVGGDPVTATPFGALQRIEDLGSFKLSGGRMSRLRYMVKRLEKAGYISGYGAHLNFAKLGEAQLVFTSVTLGDHRREDFVRFEQAIRGVSELIECHLVSGGFDYLLKFVTRGIGHYQDVVDGLLDREIGIAKYFTYVVIKSPIVRADLPIETFVGVD